MNINVFKISIRGKLGNERYRVPDAASSKCRTGNIKDYSHNRYREGGQTQYNIAGLGGRDLSTKDSPAQPVTTRVRYLLLSVKLPAKLVAIISLSGQTSGTVLRY